MECMVALGHVSSIKKPVPVAGGTRLTIGTGYDFRGNLHTLQDPLSHTTAIDVNGHGEAQSVVSPDTGRTTNVFDANGNLTSRTDARGITTTYRYDALSRLVREDYPGWEPGSRYGRRGAGICKRSATQRYSECLRHGIEGIKTPPHGVDTPL